MLHLAACLLRKAFGHARLRRRVWIVLLSESVCSVSRWFVWLVLVWCDVRESWIVEGDVIRRCDERNEFDAAGGMR